MEDIDKALLLSDLWNQLTTIEENLEKHKNKKQFSYNGLIVSRQYLEERASYLRKRINQLRNQED
ncbi:hypothetical protein [Succinimonas sp.]|uniref:hypothetical protein n=1 Tax=Succinimonas sp. TaxID=1936151 RepID=UPI003867B6AC